MIAIDNENRRTVCECDRCGAQAATERADGVIPDGWMTGHLWLDISLGEQRQHPLCFCPDCRAVLAEPDLRPIIDAEAD